jgi:hypothetical protein
MKNLKEGYALAWTFDDEDRHIYLLRLHIDKYGDAHEENRTAFYQDEWLLFSDKQWEDWKSNWIKRANSITDQHGQNLTLEKRRLKIY